MDDDELKNKAIERYLLMEMTSDERESFEKEITQNPELKEQVAIYKALYSIDDDATDWITTEEDKDLLKKEIALFRAQETKEFSSLLKKYRQTNTKKKSSIFTSKVWSAIAAILIIGGFILYPKASDLPDVYEHYHNWEELPSFVSKGDDTNRILKDIESSFRSKEYQHIISLSETIDPSVYESNPQVLLYIGVSYLEINQYKNSIEIFDRLIQSNTIDFHKGYWYKALAYLKQNDQENALKTLEIIVSNTTYYNHTKAKELIDEID